MGAIQVDAGKYVSLLIEANCTDPERWPAEARAGAALLARIRQMEADCAAEHGVWDWGVLPEELQDEYDSTCAELDRLLRPLDPNPDLTAEEVFAKLRRKHGLCTE
jgi:hypothetical protein